MIRLACRVEERGRDVLGLEEGIVAQDLLMRGAGSKELEQIHHAKASAADARPTATLAGFDGDPFEWVHGGRLVREHWLCQHGLQLAHPPTSPSEIGASLRDGIAGSDGNAEGTLVPLLVSYRGETPVVRRDQVAACVQFARERKRMKLRLRACVARTDSR